MNTVLLCFDDKISTISTKKTRTEKSQEIKGFCRNGNKKYNSFTLFEWFIFMER